PTLCRSEQLARQRSDEVVQPLLLGAARGSPEVDAALRRVLLDLGELVVGEVDACDCGDVRLEMLHAAGTGKRRGDARITKRPGQGHLGEALPAAFCDLVQRTNLLERLGGPEILPKRCAAAL